MQKQLTSALVILLFLVVPSFADEPNHEPLGKHTASVVKSNRVIKIPCSESLVQLLFASARNAGKHEAWKTIDKKIAPTNFVTFKTEAFGPYKVNLGSRGFSGLRSVTVEIDKPYRVMIEDAGEVWVSKLPEDSDILHANLALWQTSFALQKDTRVVLEREPEAESQPDPPVDAE